MKNVVLFLFFISNFLFAQKNSCGQKFYAQPHYNIWNIDSVENADEVYHLGWSKNGKYYAYMVSGYIDGGMDGLTVRFYVLNTSNNKIEKKLITFASYETPIADAWKSDYGSIQAALCVYGIKQDTNRIELQNIPVTTIKGDTMSVKFEMSDTLTQIYVSYLVSNTNIAAFDGYIASIYCIGWLKCPYDKNKYMVYTTSNRGSSEYYVQAFAIDRRKLMR